MNLEKLSQPINTQSIEEHEKMLAWKMTEINLEYVDRLFSKKIPPMEKRIDIGTDHERDLPLDDLVFLINRYTTLLRELVQFRIAQKKKEGIEWKPEMYDPAEEEYKKKITTFFEEDNNNWVEKTIQLLKEETKKAENSKEKRENLNETNYDDNKKREAGLIHFDEDSGYDSWFKDAEIKPDIKKEDTCISIHLDPLYKKNFTNTEVNIFSSKSLEKLAVKIVEEFPETKAVIAQSWLLDTPIAQRIGFKIYKRKDFDFHGSFWHQFINSNGQIDEARVKKFLETGKPPYGVALGAIMTEDFLKKYLPKEKRGEIILKEVDPIVFNKIEIEKETLKQIKINWDELTEEGIDNIISKCEILKQFFQSDAGSKYLDIFKNLKRENKSLEEAEKVIDSLEFQETHQADFEEFCKSIKFINKKVLIE